MYVYVTYVSVAFMVPCFIWLLEVGFGATRTHHILSPQRATRNTQQAACIQASNTLFVNTIIYLYFLRFVSSAIGRHYRAAAAAVAVSGCAVMCVRISKIV